MNLLLFPLTVCPIELPNNFSSVCSERSRNDKRNKVCSVRVLGCGPSQGSHRVYKTILAMVLVWLSMGIFSNCFTFPIKLGVKWVSVV